MEFKPFKITPELLKKWDEEGDEGFIGAGRMGLKDVIELARRMEAERAAAQNGHASTNGNGHHPGGTAEPSDEQHAPPAETPATSPR